MRRWGSWQADVVRFEVSGRGAQHFLSAAAKHHVRLKNVRCTARGYAATAAGADCARLLELARRGGWELTVLRRRGPGRWLERLRTRPGLPAGAAVFVVLLRLLTGFVWSMDFGTLDNKDIAAVRTLLAEHQIWEGARVTKEMLAGAQNALSARSGNYGWVSLNFTGGCLLLESAPAEFRPVQPEPSAVSLEAKAGGEVLTVEVESGFAQVKPGQYVTKGQLLASSQREDRSGAPVTQAARGRVLARLELRYQAEVPLEETISALTGRSTRQSTLLLLGGAWESEEQPAFSDSEVQTEWLPLRLGRLALPGCLYRRTEWERAPRTVVRSSEAALALARRDCRRQLQQQFPDAVIEAQQMTAQCTEKTAHCDAVYIVVADIAAETG